MRFVRSSRQLPPASIQRRELYGVNLYRVLEAVLLGTVALVPASIGMVEAADEPVLRATAAAYLGLSLALLAWGRRAEVDLVATAGWGMALDVVAAAMAMTAQQGLDAAIGLMLLFNITIGSLIVGPRLAFSLAVLAALAVFAEAMLAHGGDAKTPFQPTMFTACYLAGAGLAQFLRRELQRTQALAEERGSQLLDLTDLNELVIRRMRTGVLVVDGQHRIRRFNEAAWALLGAREDAPRLEDLHPDLDRQLRLWRTEPARSPQPFRAEEDGPELLPRFAATGRTDELYLVFLDDSRVYSARAEALTLATLGRLGAGIAHEIRNPLGAIVHASQLLEESPVLPPADRRLLEIILGQCRRMDGIIDSVLGLARREPAQAEPIPLPAALHRFADDYATAHPLGADRIEVLEAPPLAVVADPRHLEQVLTVLVDNARDHGRQPGQPARIQLRASAGDGGTDRVDIEVIDHGPGIPPAVVARLFEPFFTTSEHGTGLGLYIARQLCEANQGQLRFQPVLEGGASFRIRLPGRTP